MHNLHSEILLFLAQASITLMGFVSIFFIFRYKSLDAYVDNRRVVLRSLLRKRIQKEPEIEVRIETIGYRHEQDLEYFIALDENVDVVLFFVRELLKLAQWRRDLKRRAMLTLIFLTGWTILTLACRVYFWHYPSTREAVDWAILILSGGFALALLATLKLLYRSFGQRFIKR